MGRVRRSPGLVLAGACALSACAVGGATTDRAGNPSKPHVVTIGTEEIRDVAVDVLTRFADRVSEISDGRIEVDLQLGVASGGTAWDQRVIELAASGRYDGVMARAGAWHSAGVTTLDVLQLPGLVDSDVQANRLASDDEVVHLLLDGLAPAGFTGLGLYPEAPRYLMLLDGSTDFSLPALAGRAIRTPLSETVFAVLTALGMRPVDIEPAAFIDAVTSGEVTATEGHLARVSVTVTAAGDSSAAVAVNVPLYTKFLVLAMRDGAVPDEVMDVLRRAAGDVVPAFLDARPKESDVVGAACAAGGVLIEVPEEDRLALAAGARPVVEAFARGPHGALLERLRSATGEPDRPTLRCR